MEGIVIMSTNHIATDTALRDIADTQREIDTLEGRLRALRMETAALETGCRERRELIGKLRDILRERGELWKTN